MIHKTKRYTVVHVQLKIKIITVDFSIKFYDFLLHSNTNIITRPGLVGNRIVGGVERGGWIRYPCQISLRHSENTPAPAAPRSSRANSIVQDSRLMAQQQQFVTGGRVTVDGVAANHK